MAMTIVLDTGGDIDAEFSPLRLELEYAGGWEFNARITCGSYPFTGDLEAIFSAEELRRFARGLESRTLDRTVVLGGHRNAQLELEIYAVSGRQEKEVGYKATLVRSADDPYPSMTWIGFGLHPDFGLAEAQMINYLLRSAAQ